MAYYFSSDTHWGHEKVIEYCKRPYHSVREMNEALIYNWNRYISDGDIVFHLGDFFMGWPEKWEAVFNQLNSKENIVLVRGNHDKSKSLKFFKHICDEVYLTFDMVKKETYSYSTTFNIEGVLGDIAVPERSTYEITNSKTKSEKMVLWLNHYPLRDAADKFEYKGVRPKPKQKYDFALHGHSHKRENILDTKLGQLDVGVDGHGFKPYSLEQIYTLYRQLKEK